METCKWEDPHCTAPVLPNLSFCREHQADQDVLSRARNIKVSMIQLMRTNEYRRVTRHILGESSADSFKADEVVELIVAELRADLHRHVLDAMARRKGLGLA